MMVDGDELDTVEAGNLDVVYLRSSEERALNARRIHDVIHGWWRPTGAPVTTNDDHLVRGHSVDVPPNPYL